ARESELASARIEHEWRSRAVRAREQELAGLQARLTSFEELDAARAGYGDAARAVLVQANGKVNQQGAIADYLEVETGYERAGDAWIARSYGAAEAASRATPLAVATVDGDLFHGPQLVSGGGRAEARGILETKREIKDLRDRIAAEREALRRLTEETEALDGTI